MSQIERQDAIISVIVGLGNPGSEYASTRHNAGFQVVDRIAGDIGASMARWTPQAKRGVGVLDRRKVWLFKPLTFMNRSGEAVQEILERMEVAANQLIVVHDDLDLALGRIRLVRSGGAGGHRGVLSIREYLGHSDFPRLKLGIGRPAKGEAVEEYVLGPPYEEQSEAFAKMIVQAAEALKDVVSAGLVAAMNRVNRREPQ